MLAYLAPAVLALVALMQIHQAFTAGLSPWKGGGFGMFSTVRSPASRLTRAYLMTKDKRIPVTIPAKAKALDYEARTFPTPERLERLARKLASRPWTAYRFVSAEQRYRRLRSLPAGGRQEPAAELGLLRMVDDGERPEASVEFSGVELEIWELRLSGAEKKLTARPIARYAHVR